MIERYREIKRQKAAGEREEGFTLIELLIVIVVLGILAAVVVFALGGVTGTSVVSVCNADAKTVDVAVAAYEAQSGTTVAACTDATCSTSPIVGTGKFQSLQSWPANTGSDYSIVLGQVAGDTTDQVDVELGGTWSTATPPVYSGATSTVDYSASACAKATT